MGSKMIFGVATASYQVEGAAAEGGRSPSIWDTFCKVPGAVLGQDDGSVACDHYHRFREDVALIRDLGADSYRLSVAWPRVFPEKGRYNPEGMAYYKEVLAELAKQGISPAVTVYHWDLPQWAQDLGGWENRDCVGWFMEYAGRCFAELDAPGVRWITHNEPFCAAFLGNLFGVHAPGNTDLGKAMRVAHHLLLSHGLAARRYRELGGKGEIGISLNMSPAAPATGSYADGLAARLQDGVQNRWFLEPLFRKRYPDDVSALFAARAAADFGFVQDGDMEAIAAPIDFLGLNYYSVDAAAYNAAGFLPYKSSPLPLPQTYMGWYIDPKGLSDIVAEIRGYTPLPIFITENGSCWDDKPGPDGAVRDAERVDYLLAHLAEVEKLNREGMGIAGYYCWSLMDNFEWAFGYSRRFGITYVDYATQRRVPKDSYYAYQKYIREAKEGVGA